MQHPHNMGTLLPKNKERCYCVHGLLCIASIISKGQFYLRHSELTVHKYKYKYKYNKYNLPVLPIFRWRSFWVAVILVCHDRCKSDLTVQCRSIVWLRKINCRIGFCRALFNYLKNDLLRPCQYNAANISKKSVFFSIKRDTKEVTKMCLQDCLIISFEVGFDELFR